MTKMSPVVTRVMNKFTRALEMKGLTAMPDHVSIYALRDLVAMIKELEKRLTALEMNHSNLFQDYLHYKVNHP